MIKLKINGKPYKIPERYTIAQWMELVKWDWEEPLNYPKIIHLATGAPISDLIVADEEAIELAMTFIISGLEERTETKLKINKFEDLKFGEWVDLDVYFSLGIDKNLDGCIEILAKEIEYSNEALWVIESYSKWRNSVYRSYATLFGLNDPEGSEEDDEPVDKLSIARGWYNIIVTLAMDDILKIDEVVEQPYKKVFNFMAMQKQKQLEENSKKLQERRQNELQLNRRTL